MWIHDGEGCGGEKDSGKYWKIKEKRVKRKRGKVSKRKVWEDRRGEAKREDEKREKQRRGKEKIGEKKENILVLSSLILSHPFLFCDVLSWIDHELLYEISQLFYSFLSNSVLKNIITPIHICLNFKCISQGKIELYRLCWKKEREKAEKKKEIRDKNKEKIK